MTKRTSAIEPFLDSCTSCQTDNRTLRISEHALLSLSILVGTPPGGPTLPWPSALLSLSPTRYTPPNPPSLPPHDFTV